MAKLSYRKGTPEGLIKRQICEFLLLQTDCFFWLNESVGIYDPVRKIYRKKNSRFSRKGVADILGIWKGMPLAIEVKSAKGVLSSDQKIFLEEFKEHGGIAFVAKSLTDVKQALGV